MVTRLQVKASQIGKILSNLERKGAADAMTDSQMSTFSSLTQDSSSGVSSAIGPPSKKAHLRVGAIPPFNANKLRKSPSVGASTAATTTKPIDEISKTVPTVEPATATDSSEDPKPVQDPPKAD